MSEKRRHGDRRDGTLVRDLDSMHVLMPYLYPNRADNEAFVNEEFDLTALNAYLAKKNAMLKPGEDKYTILYAVCAALVRAITLRPRMNRFIKNGRMYQRNHLSLAFVVKKQFTDEAKEALAYLRFGPDTTIDTLHERLQHVIHDCRDENKVDQSTGALDMFAKIPTWFLSGIAMPIVHWMDNHGLLPDALIGSDPNHASVFISNLGSIKLNAAYHHLSNFGTSSIFVVIGRKHLAPAYAPDGSYEMREFLPVGITLDERIADGLYYSKTIALVKHLIANPELLEERADKEVNF